MGLGDVVDKFLNQDSLSDTGTSEKTNFSTTGVGSKQVDNLDTRLEDLSGRRLVDERRGVRVDGGELDALNGTTLVNWLADDVHDTTESGLANGNTDGSTSVDDLLTTDETLSTVHGDSAAGVFTKMGGDLEDKTTTMEVLNLKSVQNRRKVLALELDVDNSTDDLLYGAKLSLCLRRI